MTEPFTICGTGHRPKRLGGYDEDVWNNLVGLATDALKEHKPEIVLSGMAIGWDQALAQAAIDLKIRFIAVVPFVGYETSWPAPAIARFDELLRNSYHTVYVCNRGYDAYKLQARNRYMVDNSQKILALWDGSSSGTKNCIDYANSKHVPVVNLWDKWIEIQDK